MKKRIPFLIVIVLIILHAVCNYIWLTMDERPLWDDFGAYFGRSINIYRSLTAGPSVFIKAVLGQGPFLNAYHPHRIILPVAPLPAYFLFGIGEDVAVMSLVIFFAVLALSLYGIVKECISPKAGALAVFMVLTTPGIFWLSRHFSPEFVTTALMALSVYLLIKSDNFHNRGYSALLGLSTAAGLLTKGTYFVFIIGPLVYALLDVIIGKEKRAARLWNFIIFFGLCALLIAPWYVLHLKSILSRIVGVPFSEEVVELYGMPDVISLRGASFYLRKTINWGASFFYFLLFIPSCFYFSKYMGTLPEERSKRTKYIIWAWIIVPYVFFTLVPSKCEEYFNPYYPVIAVVTAVAVFALSNKLLKKVLIAAILVVGCTQFYYRSFAFIDILPKRLFFRVAGFPVMIVEQDAFCLPKKGGWKVKEILTYIYENGRKRYDDKKILKVWVIPDRGEMSRSIVKYYADWLNFPFNTFGLISGEDETESRMIEAADFIITKTGYQGLYLTEKERKEVIERIEQSEKFFKLPNDFSLPDETVISVYQRKEKNGAPIEKVGNLL